jgi:hypothetical protein
MKTDSLLTMEQYLDECRLVPTLAKSPARNARHVLVEPARDVDLAIEPQACTCDRWGHPCDDFVDTKLSNRSPRPKFSAVKPSGEQEWNT